MKIKNLNTIESVRNFQKVTLEFQRDLKNIRKLSVEAKSKVDVEIASRKDMLGSWNDKESLLRNNATASKTNINNDRDNAVAVLAQKLEKSRKEKRERFY